MSVKASYLRCLKRQYSSKGWGDFMHYAFLGICKAIFWSRDLIFCVEPHIIIYLTDIKYLFNFDNLEPAAGYPG